MKRKVAFQYKRNLCQKLIVNVHCFFHVVILLNYIIDIA
nr:MAG TPA: hypothetical protein [Caudoviricetes sp.]